MNVEQTEQLNNLSVYELFCFNTKINELLESSKQTEQIKNSLKVGQVVEYFNRKLNKLIPAVVIEKQIKRVLLQHVNDKGQWWTRYYTLNINKLQINPITKSPTGMLTKNSLSIGDIVGFEHNGGKIIGKIIKLNPKTIKMDAYDKGIWNVGYTHLFQVIDSSKIIDVELLPLVEEKLK